MEADRNVGHEGVYEPHRISKPDLFMAVALWMEISPLANAPSHCSLPQSNGAIHLKKSGAVYALPNERILSVDCSQNGVHAAVSALNKFGHEKVKGCRVYLSRRPCSLCAKLLVQCGVSKVFYLPIEPEWDDPVDVRRVDSIFLSSSVGLSIKVPKLDDAVFQDRKQSPYTNLRSPQSNAVENYLTRLRLSYWNANWIERANESLRWPAFDDLKDQITNDINALFKWIAHATILDVPEGTQFFEIVDDLNYKDEKKATEHCSADITSDGNQPSISQQEAVDNPQLSDGCPNPSDEAWQNIALHMSRLAQMLSQRSDDPTRGVGCVLMLHNEIVAVGWNGFPAKALYGEFPRTSTTDEARDKKEPYVIHAEQNALIMRTKRNLTHESSVLFINEVPCDQCIPMLLQVGVKRFVIPKVTGARSEAAEHPPPSAAQENLQHALTKGITCYGSKQAQGTVPQSSRVNLRNMKKGSES